MNALALTDHGNLHGALEFYRKAKDAGINPILGYEAYIAPGSRFEKKDAGQQQGGQLPPDAARPEPHRLQEPDQAGLGGARSKASTTSRGSTRRFSQRHSEGIICLSRLRVERVQPRAAQGRRRRRSDFARRCEIAALVPQAVRRPLLHRDHEQRRRDPAAAARRRPSIWPSSSAFRWSRPATPTTSTARTPKPRTCCSASTPASSAPTPTA